jgi:hypothetical protein
MNEQRAVIQQMVDALDHADELLGNNDTLVMNGAAAGRWLLEQPAPVQEPVAYCDPSDPFSSTAFSWPGTEHNISHTQRLYTTPPAQPSSWVGLTDEERRELRKCNQQHDAFAKAIEAKLKEKNT